MALVVKNPSADAGNIRARCSIPSVRKTLGRRKCLPTPVFLPGKSHGQRNLRGAIVHTVAKSQT